MMIKKLELLLSIFKGAVTVSLYFLFLISAFSGEIERTFLIFIAFVLWVILMKLEDVTHVILIKKERKTDERN